VSEQTADIINDVGWLVVAALAAISTIRAAIAVPGCERAAWPLFAAGGVAWGAGRVIWKVSEICLSIPAPALSYADIGYLAFGPLMVVGLFVLRATQNERRLTWLRVANLGLLLCSLASVLITSFSQPIGEIRNPFDAALIVVSENATVAVA